MKFPQSLEAHRVLVGERASPHGADYGMFILPLAYGGQLCVIASPGDANEGVPWEHVSVSLTNRCPTWLEMDSVKRLFWDDEDAVMQLHPPRSTWVSNHPYCLHLWRPTTEKIPLPPMIAV